MVAEGDKKRVGDLFQGAIKGQFSEFEFEAGSGRFYQSSFVPVSDTEGTVIRVMGLTQDITERKKTEHDRRLQTNLLERIFDSLPDLLGVKDTNSTYIAANKSFCHFLNKREEEIVGKTDIDLFPERDAEQTLKIEAEAVQKGRACSVVEEITGVQGKERLQITRVPIYDKNTEDNTRILVWMRQLTEKQR